MPGPVRAALAYARQPGNTNGRFAEEVVAVEVKQGKKSMMVEKDDHLSQHHDRRTRETSAGLRPESFVTAAMRRASSTAPRPWW